MRKTSLALAFIAGLLALPAQAANFTAKDASAATIIFTNPGNCTTGCTPIFSWSDSTGANLVAVLTAGADGASNTANGGLTYGRNLVFNGTTWDRWTGAVTVSGVSTAANQTTGNTSLASIDTKTPALGQALAAASVPVILPSATITTLTPPTAVGLNAGTNVVGKFGIDQTTPGTTNLVSIGTNGTVNPQTAANWGIGTSTQNSASVANGHLALGQFNTTPTTITTGNMSPLQMDNAGNLLVNIKAGAGSGGTAIADNSAFTQSTTNETPAGCLFNTAYAAATSGRSTVIRCLSDGSQFVNTASWAGTALGAPSNYGTSPGAVAVPGVNAFVTNSNANGSATSANSSPVVIASDQAAVKVSPQAITTGGSSTTGNIAANNTTAVVVKASAGTLYGVQLAGIGSAPAYLKIYNATSATCGSGTPVKRLMIPAASTAANGAGSNISFGPAGVAFGTGITYCITTGIGDADTTAPAASTFLVNIDWQ